MSDASSSAGPVCLVSAGASRLGSAIVRALHASGARVAIHYHRSAERAATLAAELEGQRPNSAFTLQADIRNIDQLSGLVSQTVEHFGSLQVLVNNASSFYPSPLGSISAEVWDDLVGTNLKAPLFLSQAAIPHLRESGGAIVNMVDIHHDRPFADHAVYNLAKGGLANLTRSLAWDLGPTIRVNGIAPGVALNPDEIKELADDQRDTYEQATALKRVGSPTEMANAVRYLALEASYVTGHILVVDGGQSIL